MSIWERNHTELLASIIIIILDLIIIFGLPTGDFEVGCA